MVSQHRLKSFFHEIKCNGMTSFMELMRSGFCQARDLCNANIIVIDFEKAFDNMESFLGNEFSLFFSFESQISHDKLLWYIVKYVRTILLDFLLRFLFENPFLAILGQRK